MNDLPQYRRREGTPLPKAANSQPSLPRNPSPRQSESTEHRDSPSPSLPRKPMGSTIPTRPQPSAPQVSQQPQGLPLKPPVAPAPPTALPPQHEPEPTTPVAPPVMPPEPAPQTQPTLSPERIQAPAAHDPMRERRQEAVKGKTPTKPTPAKVKNASVVAKNRTKIIRVGTFLTMGLLGLFGLKAILFPVDIPNPDTLAYDITYAMNKTAFPAERAQGFAQQYMSTYLTIGSANPNREQRLMELSSSTETVPKSISFPSDYQQNISDGPYVYDVRYITDETAVFTVGAEVNGKDWEYYAVNVYYDRENAALLVPTAPTLARNPVNLGTVPGQSAPKVDEEASASARGMVETFFKAWTADSETDLSVTLSPDVQPRAKGSGLQESGISFSAVSGVSVIESPEEYTGTQHAAIATVEFSRKVGAEGSITYYSTYNLLLEYNESTGKWLVYDILPREFVYNEGTE